MSNLISGKEALIALANGDEVEFIDGRKVWENLKHNKNMDLSMFLDTPDWCKFRLKQKTIMVNGVEVPKTVKPEFGKKMYSLALFPIDEEVSLAMGCTFAFEEKDAYKARDAIREIFKCS